MPYFFLSPLDKLVTTWIAIWWVEAFAMWVFTVAKEVRLIRSTKNAISALKSTNISTLETVNETKWKNIEKEINEAFRVARESKALTRVKQNEIIDEVLASKGIIKPKPIEPYDFEILERFDGFDKDKVAKLVVDLWWRKGSNQMDILKELNRLDDGKILMILDDTVARSRYISSSVYRNLVKDIEDIEILKQLNKLDDIKFARVMDDDVVRAKYIASPAYRELAEYVESFDEITHVLRWNVKYYDDWWKSVGGFHHKPSAEWKAKVVQETTLRNDKKFYKAKVEILDETTWIWESKSTESTMFPDHRTQEEVLETINKVYKSRDNYSPDIQSNWRLRYDWIEVDNVDYRMILSPEWKIITVFPIY